MAEPEPTPQERTEARFFTASGGKPPTDEQRTEVEVLRGLVYALGLEIEASVPNGRNKSLALTALEDVQMRANRAIFEPGALWPADSRIVDAPRPASTPPATAPGRVVHYCLAEGDVVRINRRRSDEKAHRDTRDHDGAIVHVGNEVREGDYLPLHITRVWPGGGLLNGQVILDGNDTLWVTSVAEGSEPGTWTWPPRV